jgi:hypothetical protein
LLINLILIQTRFTIEEKKHLTRQGSYLTENKKPVNYSLLASKKSMLRNLDGTLEDE